MQAMPNRCGELGGNNQGNDSFGLFDIDQHCL